METQPDPAQRELIRARTLATDLADFSARVGHDLLGPLNQASSLLSFFVQRQGGETDAETTRLLEFLQISSGRMERVVAATERHLKIAAAAPRVEKVDGNAALDQAQQRLESAIRESSTSIAAEKLPEIPGNPDQMATLFEILIGNCIRFRRPTEPARIRITSECRGHWVFKVEDNGIGIDAAYRETVFQPFRRLHGKDYPGAGMGLATAKLIVELHGGRIWIEPAESMGTVVAFTAPAWSSAD
jgi:light-regulated signal transduction histidine kinase (bacteriophytochrome)